MPEFFATSWGTQLIGLTLAMVLSSAIGLERQIQRKDAGLKTHALVGLGAALFVVLSKYGFEDVLRPGLVILDPSRVAAQIVSGIGFLGAGLVVVRRSSVRGLTTAAGIWLTAAVGAAAGAGLWLAAMFIVVLYFVVVFTYPWIVRRARLNRGGRGTLLVSYLDGTGALRSILSICVSHGFAVEGFTTQVERPPRGDGSGRRGIVELELELHGARPVETLVTALMDADCVQTARIADEPE